MSENAWGGGTFVIALHEVRRAITTLKPLSIHETLPAYLHLRRQSASLKRFDRLEPHWQGEVHEWLDVPGGPVGKPHFRPFTTRGSSLNSFWVIENLPGLYAQSSLRTTRSLMVDEIDQYRLPTHPDGLPDPHPISKGLLGGAPIPAWAIAAFLYRNRSFGWHTKGTDPSWADLLDVFQGEFRWTDEERLVLFSWDHPNTRCFEEA